MLTCTSQREGRGTEVEHLSIGGVCFKGMGQGCNGLRVIVVLSMHCAQQAPGVYIVWLPLHLLSHTLLV